jgi:hypothetical protein
MEPAGYTLGNLNYTNGADTPQSFTSMSWTYNYDPDGRVNHALDSSWHFWDRSYTYDHVGRLQEADTNRVANGFSWDTNHPDPYKQTSSYDVFNNLKLSGYLYSNPQSDSATYSNNRRSDSSYDANGMVKTDLSYSSTYDVASKSVHSSSLQHVGDGSSQWPQQPALEISQAYDANGQPCKRTEVTRSDDHDLETRAYLGVSEETVTDHYLYSSVLGAQVVDINSNGQTNIWVYAGGQRIATAIAGTYGNTTFEHHNPATASRVTTNGHSSNRAAARQETDPQTAPIALSNPGGSPALNWNQPLMFIGGDPSDYMPGVTLDGMPMRRADYARMYSKGGWIVEDIEYHIRANGDGGELLYIKSLGSHLLPDPGQDPGTAPKSPPPQFIQPRNLLANIFHLLDDARCSSFVSDLINTARQLTGKTPFTYDGKVLALEVANNQPDGGISTYNNGVSGGTAFRRHLPR